jgi:hypothetical protein
MGLQLKNPAAGASASEGGSGSSAAVGPVGHPSSKRTTTTTTTTGPGSSHKRKLDPPASEAGNPSINASHDHNNIKRPRKESSSQTPKKVSFDDSQTPTKKGKTLHSKPVATPNKAAKQQTPQSSRKANSPSTTKTAPAKPTKEKAPSPADIKSALEYLRQWKSARESWKFNKNHQSTLIKYAFEPDTIPAQDIAIFYEYIQDLKGFVRVRLREMAMEIKMRDESDGYAAFPEDAMDLDEKQETYESILADILRRRQQNGKRKYFAESQFIAESQDGSVIVRRLVKRMRAEMVLDELSDGETTDSTTTSSVSTASSKTITASDNNANTATAAVKAKLNDVSGKRRRKLRVNMDDSSSSESESDSDSDSDSSSSSEESDSDEDEDMRPGNGYDTSSSSSSSSSSSGGSDSEDDSEDDDDE